MKTKIAILLLGISVLGYAQEKKFLSQLNIAVGISTMGIGVEFATPINDYFNLRVGYSGLSLSTDTNISVSDKEIYNLLSYNPDYKFEVKYRMNHGNALVDFTPVKRGFFHFTAGFFIGETGLSGSGLLINPTTKAPAVNDLPSGASWPNLSLERYNIAIGERGDVSADLTFGNTVKPYLGIGLGRAVTNNRIGFKFELGLLYQGAYKLSQNGKKVELNLSGESDNTFKDVNSLIKILEWWPMLNFQLSYRIF